MTWGLVGVSLLSPTDDAKPVSSIRASRFLLMTPVVPRPGDKGSWQVARPLRGCSGTHTGCFLQTPRVTWRNTHSHLSPSAGKDSEASTRGHRGYNLWPSAPQNSFRNGLAAGPAAPVPGTPSPTPGHRAQDTGASDAVATQPQDGSRVGEKSPTS